MSDNSDTESVKGYSHKGKRSSRRLSASDSNSDSDSFVENPTKRKRTLRVMSDAESSSSDSIVHSKGARKRPPRVMSDDGHSSSSDGEGDSDSPLASRERHRKMSRAVSDEEVSSSDSASLEDNDGGEDDLENEESGVSVSGSDDSCSFEGSDVSTGSEWESDWYTGNEEEEEVEEEENEENELLPQEKTEVCGQIAPTAPTTVLTATTSTALMSDSSDGESEKCPICLLSFTTQEVGTPEACDHSFCSICLQEWAKNMNTCPVDRQVFTLILVRRHLEGKVIKRIPVEARRLGDEPEVDEDPTFCEVCGRSDREDRLLLCDGCDLGYHLECLEPPMETVPVEEWFCPDCTLTNSVQIAEEVDIQDGELMDLLEDANDVGFPSFRPRASRLLPRTRQSERVRATIRQLQRDRSQPSTSSGIESLGAESNASVVTPSTTAPRRRKKVVRRKGVKRRKRRTIKKKSTTKRKTTTKRKLSTTKNKDPDNKAPKKQRRRRRKIKRRKKKISRRRVAKVVVPLSVKGRLAEQLGMFPPNRPGLTLPVVRSRPSSTGIDFQRSRAGIPTLHLFGQRNELDYFSGSDNEFGNDGGGSVAVSSHPRVPTLSTRPLLRKKMLSVSARRSHTAIRSANPGRRRIELPGPAQVPTACDLIGSILDSQSIWHSNKAKVTINRDGSLQVKKNSNSQVVKKGSENDDHSGKKNTETGSVNSTEKDNSLLRKDDGLSRIKSETSSPVNVGEASARTTQAPLYPGRGGAGGSRPPSGTGYSRYSSSYNSFQGIPGYSNLSSPVPSFDSQGTRAGYASFLSTAPPAPYRGSSTPMRFRLAPRFPLRRPPPPPPFPPPQRQLKMPPKVEENKLEEEGEVIQKPPDEEEDEIDIYSDIEMGGGGSGGPGAGNSEVDESERIYEALPPPPEPSALLMGLGEHGLSDDEMASDSELVIDDNEPQIPESDKYDPAEPSYDSDEDIPVPSTHSQEIPLPPCPPPLCASVLSQQLVNSSSSSNTSYLHSPTYGENSSSFEPEKKLTSVTTDGVVNQVVKEVLKECFSSSSAVINADTIQCRSSPDADDDEGEDCPNFSIYSALSMDIARRTGEEQDEVLPCSNVKDNSSVSVVEEKEESSSPSQDFENNLEVENINDTVDAENNKKIVKEDMIEDKDMKTNEDLIGDMDRVVIDEDLIGDKDRGIDEDVVDDKDKKMDENVIDDKDSEMDEDVVDVKDSEMDEDVVKVKDRKMDEDMVDVKDSEMDEGVVDKDRKMDEDGVDVEDRKIDEDVIDVKDIKMDEDVVDKKDIENDEAESKVIDADEPADKDEYEDRVKDDNSEVEDRDKDTDEDEDKDKTHVDEERDKDRIDKADIVSDIEDSLANSKLNDEVQCSVKLVQYDESPSKDDIDLCDERSSSRLSDEQDRAVEEPKSTNNVSESQRAVSEEDDVVEVTESPHSPRDVQEPPKEDKSQSLVEEIFGSDDNDSLIGGATSAVSAATIDNNPPPPLGLEGLDTETISETEEAINFDDDLSPDGNEFLTAEEDGEIPSVKRKKKKKSRKSGSGSGKEGTDEIVEKDLTPLETVDYEEGEIVDDRPKPQEVVKKDKKASEKKEKARHEKDAQKSSDENFDISKSKSMAEEEKKKKKKKNVDKERTILGSSENKDKNREKSNRSEDPNVSWKKPSKSNKIRNYRDTKAAKAATDSTKDKESGKRDVLGRDAAAKKDKKKKEKRKDMERYDVRKILTDKKRKRRDEFGRDLSRDRSYTRSRSRSHRRSLEKTRLRSRSLSRSKANRSKLRSPIRSRLNRSRSRSRLRSRSRSHIRSRSRSRNKSKRKSKDRGRTSRSKERQRTRLSRDRSSRSRGKRSRTRSRSRSKNRSRGRSRSHSIVRVRERKDRNRSVREAQRFRLRRSWSRTWTPSWSRSRSRSVSCSSYSRSRSPSPRRFNRSYSRSFSRSWSRERHERIPVLEKKTGGISKAAKKLTVIVSNTKEDAERQRKKEKKRKEARKIKEPVVSVEKRKKRKEKSPAPSKEVFTSGDNILVSVNFNKSNKTVSAKDAQTGPMASLPKEGAKRKRDEVFEGERETGKKTRRERALKEKGAANADKTALKTVGEKKSKKQSAKANKSARMVAILKQKPVAIIDLDQSPFREQTPSPTDLIVLSDSEEEGRTKEGDRDKLLETVSSRRVLRSNGGSPQALSKTGHNTVEELQQSPLLSSYLLTSTGPKTPPEPQVKFSIAAKPQLRTITNPLREEDEDLLTEDAIDQRIEEELAELMHKGPNTPPEPRGPTTPCSPPTSPDVYDPFDPTKSGTPSPAGPEASMDGPPTPTGTPTVEILQRRDSPLVMDLEDLVNKTVEAASTLQSEEITEEVCHSPDRTKSTSRGDSILAKSPGGMQESTSIQSQLPSDELSQSADVSESLEKTKQKSSLTLSSSVSSIVVSESNAKSPERKISVVITATQSKLQGTPVKQQGTPIKQQSFSGSSMKQITASQQPTTSTPSHSGAPAPAFPTLTPASLASILCTPPVSRANLFSVPQSLVVPPLVHHHLTQNGETQKPMQDTTTEVVDMDLDSPYSPGSSEGDDLFDPPTESGPPSAGKLNQPPPYRPPQPAKSSNKLAGLPLAKQQQDKFESIFGPLRVGKPATVKTGGRLAFKGHHKATKSKGKHGKGGRKEIAIKMDEDQLQILEDLPSSAVELQFLKKLNRQERVVEEVKLSLKPHYTKKHISKDEYKNILRRSVPKICHNKSGEINPIKISTLVEAYVKKYRYAKKKKGTGMGAAKPKVAKNTMWS